MSAEGAAAELGRFLTGTEAGQLAGRLAAGETLTMALRSVAAGRRQRVRELLGEAVAGLGGEPGSSVAAATSLLRAIEGARTQLTGIQPVWTMPGHVARLGALTGSVVHLVDNARQSVTCSTFNFQRTSALWDALARAARRPEVAVRVYLDAAAAGRTRRAGGATPSAGEVAAHLFPAVVLRTSDFDGLGVRNHAKFLVIDHRFLLVTSANFSWSAENGNIELGVLHDNRNLADTVEREMRGAEDSLFERVPPGGRRGG